MPLHSLAMKRHRAHSRSTQGLRSSFPRGQFVRSRMLAQPTAETRGLTCRCGEPRCLTADVESRTSSLSYNYQRPASSTLERQYTTATAEHDHAKRSGATVLGAPTPDRPRRDRKRKSWEFRDPRADDDRSTSHKSASNNTSPCAPTLYHVNGGGRASSGVCCFSSSPSLSQTWRSSVSRRRIYTARFFGLREAGWG